MNILRLLFNEDMSREAIEVSIEQARQNYKQIVIDKILFLDHNEVAFGFEWCGEAMSFYLGIALCDVAKPLFL